MNQVIWVVRGLQAGCKKARKNKEKRNQKSFVLLPMKEFRTRAAPLSRAGQVFRNRLPTVALAVHSTGGIIGSLFLVK